MHRSRLFWKLYLSYVALIVLTATSVGVLISRSVEADFAEETRGALHSRALMFRQMALPILERGAVPAELTALQEKVKQLGLETGTRFTLIDASGKVLADSEHDPELMDDHSSRPEVLDAVRTGVGTGTRYSRSVGARMMYLALPLGYEGMDLGFARTSIHFRDVDERLRDLRVVVGLGALIAALAALAVGLVVAQGVTRPLVEMSEVARSIASGNYDKRLEIHRRDEMGLLARSFNLMAGEAESRIRTITDDRNRLLTILGGMVEGVVAVDREARVLHMNQVAGRIFGTDPAATDGRPVSSLTRVQEIVEALTETIRSGVIRQREVLLPAPPKDRVLDIHSAPIRDGEGRLAGAVVVLHDVTELRRLEGVRRDFVTNVSHELKTPITVVRGTVETLLDDPGMDESTRLRFLRKIQEQSVRMSSVVSDLLALARVESGHDTLERVALDLRDPVGESLRALSASAEVRDVELAYRGPDEPVPVLGEWASLRLAIDNLLDNAVKYSPAGGEVSVRLFRNGTDAILEVADAGVGIAPHHAARIFERFYRVDKARSRELGGTGLGLSIVKHMVQAHDGQITVDSVPGTGATFRMRLPLAGP